MSMYYTGKRPVLKGRSGTNINTFTGRVGVYSNWELMDPDHALDGAPRLNYTPGTGDSPHDLQMTRRFRGLDDTSVWKLRAVGSGTRLDGFRYRPLENKAAGNNLVFKSAYGHAVLTPQQRQESDYAEIDPYDDTYRQRRLDDPGHIIRDIDAAGTANSFGYFNIYIYKGITEQPLEDTSQTVPEGHDNAYGHNRVNEWFGVTSAKALSV